MKKLLVAMLMVTWTWSAVAFAQYRLFRVTQSGSTDAGESAVSPAKAAPESVPTEVEPRPFYKRWWFFGLMVVAGAAVVIGVHSALSQPSVAGGDPGPAPLPVGKAAPALVRW